MSRPPWQIFNRQKDLDGKIVLLYVDYWTLFVGSSVPVYEFLV